jgi:hypothetical protein
MQTAASSRIFLPAEARSLASKGIFAAAIFISAFLLFWMQPLFSKMVLPSLGGSPSVWNTAMMFFQLVLLGGYGYVHFLTTKVPRLRWQLAIHGVIVAAGLVFLPFAIARNLAPPSEGSPIPWLLGLLASSVGWPFFALSASAPLLQAWFARSGHRQSHDPYFLYAASNLGSLLALLSFPVLLEPWLTLAGQARGWTSGYAVLLVALLAVGVFVLRTNGSETTSAAAAASATSSKPAWRERVIWIALAFVPSSLLLGVTTYITTDIASAPLLWVVPLALYLLSFIVAFARRSPFKTSWTLKAQAVGILVVATMMMLALIFARGGSAPMVAGVHLLTFFVTAVVCHSELARRRPGVDSLTVFYFCMSVGGAAGGVFNALVAPLIFSSDYEYYLALIAACALRGLMPDQPGKLVWGDVVYPLLLAAAVAAMAYRSIDATPVGLVERVAFLVPCAVALYVFAERPFRFAFGVAAVFAAALLVQGSVDVLHMERNFFGVIKVKLVDGGRKTGLIHGTTMHGTEFVDPNLRREPLAYYARSGPVGQALALAGKRPSVAAIGLGTGALACYRQPGETWTFFEIDGAVERIARDTRYFHYLADCGAGTRVVLGDGRLSLKTMPDRSYDLIVLDAFSSDSIPMHLLTKEALQLYLRKLKPRGVVLVNISNEYLNLLPVLSTLVDGVGAAGRHELFAPNASEAARGATASDWVVIGAQPADLDFLTPERRWSVMSKRQGGEPWSDDFSNIFGAVRW